VTRSQDDATGVGDPWSGMTIRELRSFAETWSIPLPARATRAELVAMLEACQVAPSGGGAAETRRQSAS
jgi:hypothetical protein